MWARIVELDKHTNELDASVSCQLRTVWSSFKIIRPSQHGRGFHLPIQGERYGWVLLGEGLLIPPMVNITEAADDITCVGIDAHTSMIFYVKWLSFANMINLFIFRYPLFPNYRFSLRAPWTRFRIHIRFGRIKKLKRARSSYSGVFYLVDAVRYCENGENYHEGNDDLQKW